MNVPRIFVERPTLENPRKETLLDLGAYLESLEQKIAGHFDRVVSAVKSKNIEQFPFRLAAQGRTDAAGNGEFAMQSSLPSGGKSIIVGRIILIADGYTPSAPFVGAVGANGTWLGIFHGRGQNLGAMDDFLPYNNQALLLPSVASYGGHNALVFQRGDDIWIGLHNGPANTNVTAIFVGWVTDFGREEII